MNDLPHVLSPVTQLKGVGPRLASRLETLGIRSIQDLLFHVPSRYQDRTRVVPIGALQIGDEAVVVGEVEHSEIVYRRRRMLLCQIADGTGQLTLRFFHFNNAQKDRLIRGQRVRCFGEARRGPSGIEMIHPEYQRLKDGESPVTEACLTPIYPTTEGLHQIRLRNLTEQVLATCESVGEYLPEAILPRHMLPTLADALRVVHRPPPDVSLSLLKEGKHPAQRRLVFEELLAHQLSLASLRAKADATYAPELQVSGHLFERFRTNLSFVLTTAQHRVIDEIVRDLQNSHPMMRLVQGDVGSGKTVVAAAACLYALEAGYQVAVMAPTEILAEQHYMSFRAWLSALDVPLAWCSGRLKPVQRKAVLARIRNGEAKLIVGTHALFQEQVQFHDLALVVIDEQHRFGVHQRMALKEKGQEGDIHPHQLIMTATPIPRTLAMTAYADLDYSVIDQLPPGRKPVVTAAISDQRRQDVIARVSNACAQGQQAYWVCTLVEESEALQCQAAEETYQQLSEVLPHLRIGLVHGRLKSEAKEFVMQGFKDGEIDLLIATTIIEVGVDVANASLMIIENSERLGLAQLHQLRGRVGRGARDSNCVLMHHGPLSEHAQKRLQAMRDTTDGFKIAQIDLQLRGPGEVLGTRQTGIMHFHIADLLRDQELIPQVQQAAKTMIATYPQQIQPLIERWLGDAMRYSQV